MAETARNNDIEEEVTCSVCYELFNNPLSLPCTHTFCYGCLYRLLAAQDLATPWQPPSIVCPKCRYLVLLPNGVEDLPRNATLANIVSSLRRSRSQQHHASSSQRDDATQTGDITRTKNPLPRNASPAKGKPLPRTEVKNRLRELREKLEHRQEQLMDKQLDLMRRLKRVEKEGGSVKRDVTMFFERLRVALGEREKTLLDDLGSRQLKSTSQCLRLLEPVQTYLSTLTLLEESINDLKKRNISNAIITEEEVTDLASRLDVTAAVDTEAGTSDEPGDLPSRLKLSEVNVETILDSITLVPDDSPSPDPSITTASREPSRHTSDPNSNHLLWIPLKG